MEKKELFELMDHFSRSGLHRMKLKDGELTLVLEKAPPAPPAPVFPGFAGVPAAAPAATAQETAPAAPAEEALFVRAPLVGTYYAAPAPGAEPFVQVGDQVQKGQTLCVIEAMKTMNEIPAPCDLIVEELPVQNGALVAFDAPVVRYRHV